MALIIGTKADTLEYLKNRICCSDIEKLLIIYVSDYLADKKAASQRIAEYFAGETIVVRSSSTNEDNSSSSNAGHYESILNVAANDQYQVINAIDEVIASYQKDIADINREQILIQRQVTDVLYSGVVFSREIKNNRPYYTITYAANSTDAVTSGESGVTIYVSRSSEVADLPYPFAGLIRAVMELEGIYENIPLDVEFAIDKQGKVILFQVRPLAACINMGQNDVDDMEVSRAIADIKQDYKRLSDMLGERNAIMSDMAFWNPAEIIGENPHPLDYSLYRDIITKSAWNQGLNYIGYKEVDGELMFRLGNKPYISLRKTFLGLMPQDIDRRLADKLLNYYNKKLLSDITAHDKVEFEIVFSNYDLLTPMRVGELAKYGFSSLEIADLKEILFTHTNNIVCNYRKIVENDLQALNGLMVHRENIKSNLRMSANDIKTLLQYVVELLESIKLYGTPKFARQARMAFIAKSFCRSFAACGYFSEKEIDDFMMSIYTVAAQYDADFQEFATGNMTREEFDERYGHLRSGTYDITCDTYASMSFSPKKCNENSKKIKKTMLELKDVPLAEERVSEALRDMGFDISAKEFIYFLKTSMEQREYFKFEFTKTLSLVIDLIAEIGERLGIEKSDMAFLDIDDIRVCANKRTEEIRNMWYTIITENKQRYRINSMLILPGVIHDKRNISYIEQREERPNFITSKCVSGEVIALEDYDRDDIATIEAVSNKIVVITKADPGYDWIFAHDILGFVTKYGGVASHMAIRCAEFDIPAAIGCGNVIYNEAISMNRMILDCKNGKIIREE